MWITAKIGLIPGSNPSVGTGLTRTTGDVFPYLIPTTKHFSLDQSLGSTGSLSKASTPKTHSCTRRSGSFLTNRSKLSMPSANSPSANDRL